MLLQLRRAQRVGCRRQEIHFYINKFKNIEGISNSSRLFPKGKFAYVADMVQQLLALSGVDSSSIFGPAPSATIEELKTAHDEVYIKRIFDGTLSKREMQRLGFTWSEAMVNRVIGSAGATIAATRYVCEEDPFTKHSSLSQTDSQKSWVFDHSKMVACHLGGGTHHAFHDYGEGYCVFNDLATAALLALREYPTKIRRVLVVDLDVHQGNGTAGIVNKLSSIGYNKNGHIDFNRDSVNRSDSDSDSLRKSLWTFSMHCKGNYFSPEEHSTVDVELPNGCSDAVYLAKLAAWLPWLFAHHKPDLVLYQAGVDIHGEDRLGKCSLTTEGLSQRNALLYDTIKAYNVSIVDKRQTDYCRLVVTLGGGYPQSADPATESFRRVVKLHSNVFTEAYYAFR